VGVKVPAKQVLTAMEQQAFEAEIKTMRCPYFFFITTLAPYFTQM
jgi:hypothetical protein